VPLTYVDLKQIGSLIEEKIENLPTRDEVLQFKDDIITELRENRLEAAPLHTRVRCLEDKVLK